jgi:hypothetical protein
MKIGITLNEVIRDFISQFAYTYDKYYDLGLDEDGKPIEFSLEKYPITDFNLLNHELVNGIKDEYELKKFMYVEAALEVFGHADQTHGNLMTHFNQFLIEMKDDEEHEVELVSREGANSIPSTYFFLSKTLCKATNIRFVSAYVDKWDGVDVLVTACPKALENKPSGKISVKVKAPYNNDVKADFEIDDLFEFMNNRELREQILGTKEVDYEELS